MALSKKQIEEKIQLWEKQKEEIESFRDELQEDFDNKSEKWQESEKGELRQSNIDDLDGAACGIGDAIDALQSVFDR